MKTAFLFAALGIVVTALWTVSDLIAQAPEGGEPNPVIVSKLEEIVQVSERILEQQKLLKKAGTVADTSKAEIALAKARAAMAKERRQSDSVLVELKRIVTIHEGRLQIAKARASDRISPADGDRIRVQLLRAQIRLARAEAKS